MYFSETLLDVLAQNPPDKVGSRLRVAMEANLEGLAYAGTAAAEKTIRSLDPDRISDGRGIEAMIREAKSIESADAQSFAREFEAWWMGSERGTRNGQIGRDLRNDAGHNFYA